MNEQRIHRLFQLSVLLKGAHSAIEIIGGIALYLVTTDMVVALVKAATQEELIEDPNDFVASHLLAMAQQFSISSKSFYAFYLLSHGVVKLLLVIGLLKNQLWSYPASLVALVAFVTYQTYRFSFTHSIGLIVLTVFDLVVMALILHEWRMRRRSR